MRENIQANFLQILSDIGQGLNIRAAMRTRRLKTIGCIFSPCTGSKFRRHAAENIASADEEDVRLLQDHKK